MRKKNRAPVLSYRLMENSLVVNNFLSHKTSEHIICNNTLTISYGSDLRLYHNNDNFGNVPGLLDDSTCTQDNSCQIRFGVILSLPSQILHRASIVWLEVLLCWFMITQFI